MFESDYYDDEMLGRIADEMARQKRQKDLKYGKRDKRGRLKKGSKIASKLCCDKNEIRRLYKAGYDVKKITERMNCSKSTVYNAIKGIEKSERADTDELLSIFKME